MASGLKIQSTTGVILSGGENTRMGQDKAFLALDGQKIIEKTTELFKKIFEEVILVANFPLDYQFLGIRTVTDLVPRKGPLGGIYTGLFYSTCSRSFVVACDMPFLDEGIIRYLISQTDDYDVVVPSLSCGLEPLHAVYSRRCLRYIKKFMDQNSLQVNALYRKVKVKKIAGEKIKTFDPHLKSFFNINTPLDWKSLKKAKV